MKHTFTLLLSCIFIQTFSFCFGKQNTGTFWHVTDIHVDQNYSRTGNPDNLCHDDKGFYPDNGLYGNFLCDSPQYLVNVTFQAMRKIKANPDFIIWTGDNLPHSRNFEADWSVIYEALHNITLLFEHHFPEIPVYPCIGNHDTFPPNILLPNKSSKSIYDDILNKGGWKRYLNEESVATFITGGFYAQVISPGLRIISLNTILWYSPNTFTEKMSDPLNQFVWMENVLKNSSKSSEMVYIIGHVPPGFYNRVIPGEKSSPTFHPQFLEAYLRILKKYSNIIKGQMFGHLHMDMFQLFQLDSGHFLSSSILGSSVTPWHAESGNHVSIPVNPSIRLLHYDITDGLLKDYDQYFLNLTKANNMNTTKESSYYELLYTFTKAYNVPDVTTESLITVYEKIKNNDSTFEKFFHFSTAGKESVLCDINCKVAQLCSISSTSMEEYNSCMQTSQMHSHSPNTNNRSTFSIHQGYSEYVTFGIVVLSLCALGFLIFFIRRYRQQRSEMYSKL